MVSTEVSAEMRRRVLVSSNAGSQYSVSGRARIGSARTKGIEEGNKSTSLVLGVEEKDGDVGDDDGVLYMKMSDSSIEGQGGPTNADPRVM